MNRPTFYARWEFAVNGIIWVLMGGFLWYWVVRFSVFLGMVAQ